MSMEDVKARFFTPVSKLPKNRKPQYHTATDGLVQLCHDCKTVLWPGQDCCDVCGAKIVWKEERK